MVTTKIRIKPHLAEYLNKKYKVENQPYIKIPHTDDLYHIIDDLRQRKSENTGTVEDGNVEIALPNRPFGKSPEFYNYLSLRSQKIIDEKVDRIFKAEMHLYMDELAQDFGMTFVDASYMFKEKYDIQSITEDALIKDYYRYRRRIGRRKKRKQKYTVK